MSSDIVKKKYLKLINELNKHNKLYYDKSSPIISDQEYDQLKIEIFEIEKNNKNISSIKAGKNYYFVSNTLTTEAGIFHDWFRDIYIILGEQHNEKWSIKIYNNPLINFIWIGIIIMILSSLVGILKK